MPGPGRENPANAMFCHPGICDCRCMSCTNAICCHYKGGKKDREALKPPTPKQKESQMQKLQNVLDGLEAKISTFVRKSPEEQVQIKEEVEGFLSQFSLQGMD